MYMSEKTLALVTGASRGIGRATALALAAAGHHVLINYVSDAARANDTLDTIRDAGGSSSLLQFDVSDADQVTRAFAELERGTLGPLGVLVNNAGVSTDALFVAVTPSALARSWAINLHGAVNCMQRALPLMMEQRYGRIVNVSSIMSSRPNKGVAAYAIAKGGLEALTRSTAVEVATRGITVNAVAPGFIQTDMTANYDFAAAPKKPAPFNAVGRAGTPEEIAAVIRFLASREASFVNGQVIIADGGAPHTPVR
jgi:3-oxoacyl-[acyl-carrier protein] reductase